MLSMLAGQTRQGNGVVQTKDVIIIKSVRRPFELVGCDNEKEVIREMADLITSPTILG